MRFELWIVQREQANGKAHTLSLEFKFKCTTVYCSYAPKGIKFMTKAYRGTEEIENEEKLKFLISELVKIENFGLFFGSGTSKCLGGFTMNEVWDTFKDKYTESYKRLFLDKYLDWNEEKNNKNQIIGQLIDKLSDTIGKSETLGTSNSEIAKLILEDLVRSLIHAAFLRDYLWDKSPEFLLENDSLFYHREVMRKILESRAQSQPEICAFTLNYDLALEWVARSLNLTVKNGFAGGATKKFNPTVFETKRESIENEKLGSENPILVNLIKIHGSLNWTFKGEKVLELPEGIAFQELEDYLAKKANPEFQS